MPKKEVTDPITDQEMAFAHLVLGGLMNDRRAAEAVGLNPDTAAYTKAKPRVRAFMIEHRAAVRAKLVDAEAEGLRQLNLGRDQVLARLWHLANLSPEATRGSIAGQMKALTMIVAIEGLIPSRSPSSPGKPVGSPVNADIDCAEWLRPQNDPEQATVPDPPVAAPPAQPGPSRAPEPPNEQPAQPLHHNQTYPVNPFVYPQNSSLVPGATDSILDVMTNAINSRTQPSGSQWGFSKRR